MGTAALHPGPSQLPRGGSLAAWGGLCVQIRLPDGAAESTSPGRSVLAAKTGIMTAVSLSGGNASSQAFGVGSRADAASAPAALCGLYPDPLA